MIHKYKSIELVGPGLASDPGVTAIIDSITLALIGSYEGVR